MKKIIAFVLAAAMLSMAVFAFAGCGKKKDTLVCGVTIFEKFNEKDANGNWTGFECDFAREVGKLIGMEVEFQQIEWKQKYAELASGAIDCIWNGFTANSSDDGKKRSDLVDFSYSYMLNQQCVVVNKNNIDSFKTEADLAGKTAAVEGGSAGASYAEEIIGDGKITTAPSQIEALMDLEAGASAFAVVDILLAKNICGNGDYTDLVIVDTITLPTEYYAIGFKKGSELTAKVNEAILTLEQNGKLLELAEKYGLENSLKVTTEDYT
ncbi:MAG: transporter substrate-binding domain-containing protein [Eubacteriales bacterium]